MLDQQVPCTNCAGCSPSHLTARCPQTFLWGVWDQHDHCMSLVRHSPPTPHCPSPLLPLQTFLWGVWDQQDPWRLRWDSVVLVSLIYVIIVTPWIIAFEINTVSRTQASLLSCTLAFTGLPVGGEGGSGRSSAAVSPAPS